MNSWSISWLLQTFDKCFFGQKAGEGGGVFLSCVSEVRTHNPHDAMCLVAHWPCINNNVDFTIATPNAKPKNDYNFITDVY